jgi:hypothetical protein
MPAAWIGIAVVLLALVPAVMRVVDGRAGWLEALYILAGAGFITFHATRLVLLHRPECRRGRARRWSPLTVPQAAV